MSNDLDLDKYLDTEDKDNAEPEEKEPAAEPGEENEEDQDTGEDTDEGEVEEKEEVEGEDSDDLDELLDELLDDDEEETDEEDETVQKRGKKPTGGQRLRQKVKRQEQELSGLRKEISDLKDLLITAAANAGRQPQTEDKPIRREDFKTDEEWFDAIVEKKIQARLQPKFQEVEAATAERERRQAHVLAFRKRSDDWIDKPKDYKEVLSREDVVVPDSLARAIITDEMGPQIGYLVSKNEELREKLSKMSPIDQAREVGRLSERLKARQKRTVEKPPAPIKVTKGGSRPMRSRRLTLENAKTIDEIGKALENE